jgi:hypothetical protein
LPARPRDAPLAWPDEMTAYDLDDECPRQCECSANGKAGTENDGDVDGRLLRLVQLPSYRLTKRGKSAGREGRA